MVWQRPRPVEPSGRGRRAAPGRSSAETAATTPCRGPARGRGKWWAFLGGGGTGARRPEATALRKHLLLGPPPRPALRGVENSGQRGGGGGWCARRSAAVVPAPPPRPSAGLRVQVSRRRTRGEDREAEESARIGPGGCEGPWWRARVGNAWEASSETPGPSPHRVLHFGACRGSDMDRQGKWWVWDEGGDRNQREGGEMRLGAP